MTRIRKLITGIAAALSVGALAAVAFTQVAAVAFAQVAEKDWTVGPIIVDHDTSTGDVGLFFENSEALTLDAGGLNQITFENGAQVVNDTNNEIQLSEGSEDLSFGFGTSNTVDLSSDTGVVGLDLAAVGTTITLANGQTIVSDTDEEIQFGDSEDVSMGFGTTNTLTWSSDTGVTTFQYGAIGILHTARDVTGSDTLTRADCGKTILVTAGIDGSSITLPATIEGCVLTFVYTGADGGALLDISPNSADGVHGSCTLASSVLELSGTDDADFGFTKATINTGDTVTIVGDGSVGWFITACTGILANN